MAGRFALGALAFALALLCVSPAAGSATSSGEGPALAFGLVSGTFPRDPPAPAEFAEMFDAGVRTYRAYFYWPDAQPSAGAFDWSVIDRQVSVAATSGVQTVPFLFGSPGWLTGCTANTLSCASIAPTATREQRSAWGRFVEAAVARYGPDGSFWLAHPELPALPIDSWEVWDEPNLARYYSPAPSAKDYSKLLKSASRAIRRTAPEATVVVGGLGAGTAPGNIPANRFLDQLYAIKGSRDLFDAVGVHPYASNVRDLKSIMDHVHGAMKRSGDSSPLWVTEVGWSSQNGNRSGLKKGLEGQARMIERSFKAFVGNQKRWNLARVYYYAWKDESSGNQSEWGATAGLVRSDLTPKPAWQSFASLMAAR